MDLLVNFFIVFLLEFYIVNSIHDAWWSLKAWKYNKVKGKDERFE